MTSALLDPRAPWNRPRGLGEVLAHWRDNPKFWRNVVFSHGQVAESGRLAPLPERLAAELHTLLGARGLSQLYSHQADCFAAATAGEHVVVATPTASGKSLCYNLPVLQRFAEEDATALYLFPTKALARDQESALRQLFAEAGIRAAICTYDGDTPPDARASAVESGRVLLTNPDMLHTGILPHHPRWARFFAALRYVVIDEMHMYRGVFGSHVANVLRRLQRVARFHRAEPRFLLASATIGNAQAHAQRLIGAPVRAVLDSGAPRAERAVLIYNPPVVNAELGIRQSAIKTAVRLTADLVRAGCPTIIFGQSRTNVEVMLRYLRDRLKSDAIDPESIVAYRGGYLPKTRRRIEKGLREGKIGCVVATNALELGIDIGQLEAAVCVGYPGSIASLWQRFGRAGRRDGSSLAVLITNSLPIDQYFAGTPETLVDSPVEEARIDPDNLEILLSHLKCAAFELPFGEHERFGDVPQEAIRDALGYLAERRVLHTREHAGERTYHWLNQSYPAGDVSLRNVRFDNIVIIDVDQDRNIGEMDWHSAHLMLHDQAIYNHEGQPHEVLRLDLDNRKAYVRPVEPDYFTTAMTHTEVRALDEHKREEQGPLLWTLSDVAVRERVVGFKKIKFQTHENVGYGEVQLPELVLETTAFGVQFAPALINAVPLPYASVLDAVRGIAQALHTIAAVMLMTDPRDLGCTVLEDEPMRPVIYLFDRVWGGIGLAPRLYETRGEFVRKARRFMMACTCPKGCPSCVGPAAVGTEGRKAPGLQLVARMERR